MLSHLHRGVTGEVPYAVLAPGDTTGLPLVLVLHGANSSAEVLVMLQPFAEAMWADGSLPPCLLASASTPTAGGFYIGRWEKLVAQEFPDFIVKNFDADPSRPALLGSSMGGYGALKLAFTEPARWRAVAAIAPALLPDNPGPRHGIGVLAQLAAEMREAGFEAESVLHRLRANASAIRASGLPIFLRCGDRDLFNLHDGTEQLHRALWDLDIGHDYHLVFDGDHVGPEAPAAQRAALAFIGSALRPPPADEESPWREWAAAGRQGPPPPLDPFGTTAPLAMRLILDLPPESRRYGPV